MIPPIVGQVESIEEAVDEYGLLLRGRKETTL